MGKAQTLLPVYLVIGTNEIKREEAIRRMKTKLDPGLAAFNLDELAAGSVAEPDTLKASLDAMPAGDAFRLVIVSEADRLAKPVQEMLVSYLKNPNPTTVLMLVVGALPKGSGFTRSALCKAVKAAGAHSVIDCTPPKPWQLAGELVQKVAPQLGITLDRDAAEELVKRSGTSLMLLRNEISQLGNLASDPGHVMLRDVETHIVRTEDIKPWELADAVSARNVKGALELLSGMDQGSYIGSLSYLEGRIRELICAKCLDERESGLGEEVHDRRARLCLEVLCQGRFRPQERSRPQGCNGTPCPRHRPGLVSKRKAPVPARTGAFALPGMKKPTSGGYSRASGRRTCGRRPGSCG
jgi:DNA polymerase-3 subunit delta